MALSPQAVRKGRATAERSHGKLYFVPDIIEDGGKKSSMNASLQGEACFGFGKLIWKARGRV